MADRVDPKTRSRIMSSIRSTGTKMELAAKPTLEALGFEYQPKDIFGKPDFAHREAMIVVFLDGCFWHGCPEHYSDPTSNLGFWAKKVTTNRERDKQVTQLLEGSGWRVIRRWEHDMANLLK